MSALKSIGLTLTITIFYFGLIFLTVGFGGAGHGSVFFYEALLAPFSLLEEPFVELGLALWPAVAILLAFNRFRFSHIAAAALLIIHYLGIVTVSLRTDWYYVGKVWHAAAPIVVIFMGAYLGSQIFMWVLITRRSHAG